MTAAATPADPAFWIMHPLLERLLQVSVCVCERERESVCVCVCMCV